MSAESMINTPTPHTQADRSFDGESRVASQEEFFDQLQAILLQESSHYSPSINYLCHPSISKTEAGNDQVNECWRRKICEWAYEVVDHFGFDREVVSIALNYLDRAVALKTKELNAPVPRRDFQLIAVTSLYLAIKVHGETDALDGPRRKLKIQAFVELSRGLFQVETLERMELELLSALNWQVNPPSTVRVVATLLRLLPKWSSTDLAPSNAANTIFEMSKYLTELSVCVSDFTFRFKPSIVAFASILCALDALKDSSVVPRDVLAEFFTTAANITGLMPSRPDVREAQHMLMELCPSMFEQAGGIGELVYVERGHENSSEGGKTSPVCVVDQMQDEISTRKRCRSTADY